MASSISLEQKDVGGVWDKNTPLQYVAQVIGKLQDGTYALVPTKCFCGAEPNDMVVAERDRYSIPHRMVMCENCALMRANPRMTEDAYRSFYEIEYRKIYDGFPHGAKSEDDQFLQQIEINRGLDIKKFLEQFDLKPKSVIDIGCDRGGSLLPFKEEGAQVWGVEWSQRGREYATKSGITTVRNMDKLIEQGITADLVIMQDIIEHFMDLREMEKVHKLLNPKGYIFLYTPGFLAGPPFEHFQNAHTFQFVGDTLEYVMNQMGYVAEFLDDRIVSLWKYFGTPLNYPKPPPAAWKQYIVEHLEQREKRTLPPVRTRCKFTETEMLANLKENLQRKLPDVAALKGTYSGSVVVVGGGPSVNGQVDQVKRLVADGAKLVVIERMYPWCSEHGLKPDFVVALDAGDDVTDGFTHLQRGTKHLIAATIKPTVLDALVGYDVNIFSGLAGSYIDAQELWSANGYDHVMIVNTGSTVVLGSIMLSLILGFRDVHLLGFDCMIPNSETTYAKGIAGKSVERTYMEVEIDGSGETVLTCPSYLAFAQQFFLMIETARKWGMIDSVTVYGESLINKMWDGDLTAVDDGMKVKRELEAA